MSFDKEREEQFKKNRFDGPPLDKIAELFFRAEQRIKEGRMDYKDFTALEILFLIAENKTLKEKLSDQHKEIE